MKRTLTQLAALGPLLAALAAVTTPIAAQQPSRTAAVEAAERAAQRGDDEGARSGAAAIVRAYEASGTSWTAPDHVAAGRAYLLLAIGNPDAVRNALAAFDAGAARDPANVEARLRAGTLFLEKYNAPDAKASFEEVLQRDPGNARALFGLARVAEFGGQGASSDLIARTLAADSTLVEPRVFLARKQLEAEAYDSARVTIRRALERDSTSLAAWSVLGATAWLQGDSATYRHARAAAERIDPTPADFVAELAEAAVRHRRYADGVRLAREAMRMDTTNTRAMGIVGTNELRAGNIQAGRAVLERAFAVDPFNLWHKNTLDLLDRLATFRTIERGRFHIVAPPEEAELLAAYVVPLLEEAYDSLARRYDYRPEGPVRLELFRQHADFSVRTVGLAGLGALGASFGPVLVMDAPSARGRGEFNWGSTAWHELAHTFTLGASANRVPRWLSEGLSVLEERRARPAWGADASIGFLAAYAGGRLRPVSQLNDGFVRPREPMEVMHSYYLASLVAEMLEQRYGATVPRDLLKAYRDGLTTDAAFQRVVKRTPQQLDGEFDAWMRERFGAALEAVGGQGDGAFVVAMREGTAQLTAGNPDGARAAFERAQRLIPGYAAADGPALQLAALARQRGDQRGALEQIARVTAYDESAWDANMMELELREALGDSAGAAAPLARLLWIHPYDPTLHARLATYATRAGDHALALRERRAVLALDPTDPVAARYELARALLASGDAPAARRETLTVLERAPSYEPAQLLLLEIRRTMAGPRP